MRITERNLFSRQAFFRVFRGHIANIAKLRQILLCVTSFDITRVALRRFFPFFFGNSTVNFYAEYS